MSNSVHSKREKRTKSDREYIRGIVHNLSFQRYSDQQIADYLTEEKNVKVSRSTVSRMKNQVHRSAESWYIELKKSSYKFISTYKERLDSLFYYQKQLHEIVASTKKEETKVRALSTIASIEMDIFSIWKQLPDLDIVDKVKQLEQQEEKEQEPPLFDIKDINGVEELPPGVEGTWHDYHKCEGCNRWFSSRELMLYHKKRSTKMECMHPNVQ